MWAIFWLAGYSDSLFFVFVFVSRRKKLLSLDCKFKSTFMEGVIGKVDGK